MAEGLSPAEEKQRQEAENQEIIDSHMADADFVNFLQGAEKGAIDLVKIEDKKIVEYAKVYDEVGEATDQITDLLQEKMLDTLELGDVADQAKQEVRKFLLERAQESPKGVTKKYIEKIRTYNENLVKIAAKEQEIAQLGARIDLANQKKETSASLKAARAKEKEFTDKLDSAKNSKLNQVKRAANWMRRKGFASAYENRVQAEYEASGVHEEANSLNATVKGIGERLTSLKNAEAEKATLELAVQKTEGALLKDAALLKEVKNVMLEAARAKVKQSVDKLKSQGGDDTTEASITLDEFADMQGSQSMWEKSPMFAKFAKDPEAQRLGTELQHVLNLAINNEIQNVDAANVGSSIDRFSSFIENSLPADQVKSQKAVRMIKQTLTDRLKTEPDRIKQLYINRVLRKMQPKKTS